MKAEEIINQLRYHVPLSLRKRLHFTETELENGKLLPDRLEKVITNALERFNAGYVEQRLVQLEKQSYEQREQIDEQDRWWQLEPERKEVRRAIELLSESSDSALIIAPGGGGKTTLLECLYLHAQVQGKIPIFVDLKSIRDEREALYHQVNFIYKLGFTPADPGRISSEEAARSVLQPSKQRRILPVSL